MKHKKIVCIFILLFAPVLVSAYISPQAQFPNKTPLQPVDPGIKPNISNNINYDGSKAIQFNPSANPEEQHAAPIAAQPESQSSVATIVSHNYIWLVPIIVVIATALVFVWIWFKKEDASE